MRPERGSALLFNNFGDTDGIETMRAVHGSCPMARDAPPKNVLVKMICDGPVRDAADGRYDRLKHQEL